MEYATLIVLLALLQYVWFTMRAVTPKAPRHPGLDPGSIFLPMQKWIPAQGRNDVCQAETLGV